MTISTSLADPVSRESPLSLRRLVPWITMLAVFAMAARISMDSDTWWHLRAGEWILAHGQAPQVDPFSFTRFGQPWQYPGWLAEAPMALLYRWLGAGGLNLWTAAMVVLAFAFTWRTLRGGPYLRAFVIVLAAAAAGVYWAARPYLVTFVLAAVFLWILEEARWNPGRGARRGLGWLPILMVIWANSHGGFAVGFLLWGVYFADSLVRRARQLWPQRFHLEEQPDVTGDAPAYTPAMLLLVGALMAAAVCLNPSGPVMLTYPFKTVGIGALQDYIQEWQSPNFHQVQVQPFAWLLLLSLGAVGASRRGLALTDFLLIVGFAYLGLMSGRNIALFALAAAPGLSRHADSLAGRLMQFLNLRLDAGQPLRIGQAVLNLVLVAVLVLAVLAKISLVLPQAANQKEFEKNFPLQAVQWIQENRPLGRLFNSYNWGGYLLWALPEYPVFIDGRTDLYNDEVIDQWLRVVKLQDGWEQVLSQFDINLVMVEAGSPLARELGSRPDWTCPYQDSLAAVCRRE